MLRRQGLYGDALAHATLPGVCVAFILAGTKTPAILLAGAAVSATLGALLIVGVVSGTRIKQDAALGIVLSVFFGFGTVLLTYIAGTGNSGQAGLDRFIFGQAATLVAGDVITMGVLGGVSLVLVALLFKEFKLLSFDPAFAASAGYPVGRLNLALTSLMVVAIIIGIQTVGVILMAAMLITPAARRAAVDGEPFDHGGRLRLFRGRERGRWRGDKRHGAGPSDGAARGANGHGHTPDLAARREEPGCCLGAYPGLL